MSATAWRTLASAVAVGMIAVLGFAAPAPASAVGATEFGVYPEWSVSGSSGNFSASPSFAASAGFPAVSVTSTATSVNRASGASSYYNAATDFGAEFGSSRSQPYLNIATASGQTPSVTTLTFAGDQPAGWGFALGDIDADWVFVRGWADDARTAQLSVAELGFQTAGNFCTTSPRPSPCSTPGLLFESPVWVTANENFDGTAYVPGTLRGSTLRSGTVTTLDSAGAYGWFAPTAQLRVLELMFGARDGFPVYSLTMAAPAPKATITGVIAAPDGIPAGTQVALQNADGTPVLDTLDQPVLVPVATDGTYTIETEQRPSYLLDPIAPPGYVDPPPFLVAANSANVTAPPSEILAIAVDSEPTPEPDPEEGLANSGGPELLGLTLIGILALVGGLVALRFSRQRAPISKRYR